MFFLQEGFTYRNFLMDALAIFFFVVWFWLLITVASDLFRRHDVSGWVKAMWITKKPVGEMAAKYDPTEYEAIHSTYE